ncbi:WD repeat [Cryptosporidium xiaoi]|uniref:WD repeat n=1 Tax=Cryptosporidium xiaoi TaxID=659607 RepID=A0AAV9Y3Q8_9CRYT
MNLLNSISKNNSSGVILQEFKIDESETICNGRLLLSHNSKLLLNLLTNGKINIWIDLEKRNLNDNFMNNSSINLKKLEIGKIFQNKNTLISDAIWSKSYLKDENTISTGAIQTLILLEQDLNAKNINCNCKQHSGIEYLTIIQFLNIDKFELNCEYKVIELEISDNLNKDNIYDKPISINFNVPCESLKYNYTDGMNIKYCRIPIKYIYNIFFNKKLLDKSNDKLCDCCFSYKNVRIFTDSLKESGFLMLMSNVIFISLDLDGSKSLYTNRRFLLQNYESPTIRYSGVAALNNWLLCITIDTYELFLWNYNEGIGFLRFDISKYIEKYINKHNTSIKVSFCNDLSKIILLIDNLNELYLNNSVKIFLIDLNRLFSELLCAYYTVKLLCDKNVVCKYDMFDPEEYLKTNMLISSGSIPHVQLDNEYVDLTIYPNAFDNFKLNSLMSIFNLKLSGGSSEYIDILKLIDNKLNWFYFYNNNWLVKEYYDNNYMRLIILNTINNILIDNNFNDNCKIPLEYKKLFNNVYLNLIKSHLESNLDCENDYSILSNRISYNSLDSYISIIEKINNNIKNNIKLSHIKEYTFILKDNFLKNIENKNKLLKNHYIDIIINSNSILIQISDNNLIGNHLSFYLNTYNSYNLQVGDITDYDLFGDIDTITTINNIENIDNLEKLFLFDIKSEYTILNLKLSCEINWNYYFMNKNSKTYMGIYSHKISLFELIHSAIKCQDLENVRRICLLNNININIIPLMQLEIGIKNSEIDMIKNSLNNISSTLNLEIVKFAKSLLLEKNGLNLSDEFVDKSCEILLNFCLDKIKYYSNNIKFPNYDVNNGDILNVLSYYSSLFREKLCKKNEKFFSDNTNENENVNDITDSKLNDVNFKIDDEIYIRDEIIQGHYSTLINWWYKNKNIDSICNLKSFRNNVLHHVYKLICNQSTNSLALGIHMLRQIGENTSKYLKLILYYTLKRDIRRKIVNHLRHINYLTDDDYDLIQFSNQLENYYFNTCYNVELNRIWTSFLTYSYPYDILRDYIHVFNDVEDKSNRNSIDDSVDDSDDEYYCSEHMIKSLTYPFGGLKTLKDAVIINSGLETTTYENRNYILKISNVILKKLSNNVELNNDSGNNNLYINNKEYAQINKDLLYSHFSKKSLDKWSDLNCKEINVDLNNENNCYNDYLNNFNNDNSLNNTISKNLPEQEGNNFLRLNNNKLINIKSSICKSCSDQNEDDYLEIEEKLLYFDKEKDEINNNNSNINIDIINNNYDLSSNINVEGNSEYQSDINSNNQSDNNSKRGDLTWLRLNRGRKSLMNNHSNNYGYINHSLDFISSWPYNVTIRIIIEKTHLQICSIWNRLLKKVQTPCKYDEAFVYSYIYLMLKNINKEEEDKNSMLILLNSNFNLEKVVVERITSIIYNSLFGFIFSHFDWMNIPQSMNYLNKTLKILYNNHNIKESYKYVLINEIISTNFYNNPKYINDVFINSLISVKLLPIHYFKTDLLENKLFQVEINKYNNAKYIINKCISYKNHGPRLFKYYLSEISELKNSDYLNLFLRIFNKEKHNDYINDYLSIVYIFMNKKENIVLLFFRETFTKFKNSISDELYHKLVLNSTCFNENINNNFEFVLNSPIIMINILIDYFANYYEEESDVIINDYNLNSDHINNIDEYNSENNNYIINEMISKRINFYDFDYDDNNLNLKPRYVLSVIFSLDVCKKEIYNENYKLFLKKYFPKLLELLSDKFIDNDNFNKKEVTNEDLNSDMNLFSISEIIKATHKDSKTLIDLINLYPIIYNKLDNKENIEDIVDFFSNKMYESIKKNNCLKANNNFSMNYNDNDIDCKLNLPILNYISKGRPFMAYILLCMRYTNYNNNTKNYDDNFSINVPNLDKNNKIIIYKAIYNLALRNFTRGIVVTSCIIFISMLGLPTELLTTDIRVARCIYNHQINVKKSFSRLNCDDETNINIDEINSDKIYEIWNLFVKFGPPQIESYINNFDNENKQEFKNNQKHSNSLFRVLKMLEEAAWDTGDITILGNNNSDIYSENDDNDHNNLKLLESAPIWHLVAVFCRLHDLPRSLTLLHELARRGEWVQFLQECDSQKCPKETVENIIDEYMSKYPILKQHLKIALKMNNDKCNNSQYCEYNNKESEYIINLLDWNILFKKNDNIKHDKLNQFYEWSIKTVFINNIMDMNGSKLLMYYSIIQENIDLFINNDFIYKLKYLVSCTINSYILIEFISSLILIFKNNNEYDIQLLFNKINFDNNTNNISECKNILEKFLTKVINEFRIIIVNNTNGNDNNINRNLNDVLKYDDDQLNEYIEYLMLNSLINISEIMKNKYKINEEHINLILNSNKNTDDYDILCMDELTIILWKLMSLLNERNFLIKISSWFYGKNSNICSMFSLLGHLHNLDIKNGLNNINNILIKNINNDKIFDVFYPNSNLLTMYYENELLYIYKNISVKNHELIWNFVHNIYSNNSNENIDMTFNLKNHLYRRYIVNLIYLDFNEYNFKYCDIEKWLCMTEIEIIREMYESGKYKLLIKYFEMSLNKSFNKVEYNNEKISLLEESTLKLISNDLNNFIYTQLFKLNSVRYEYLSNYYWNLLLNVSDSIKKISLYIAPYIFAKISIYCWYLIEKLERLLTVIDQVVLLSISLHFLSDSYKLLAFNIDENNVYESGLYSDNYQPDYFDLNYIYDCIHYLCYKLLFLYTINIEGKILYNNNNNNNNNSNNNVRIESILKNVIHILYNNCGNNLINVDLNYKPLGMEYYENLFLKIRNNSILFTPSGYFNFQNKNFNIQLPSKIQFSDYPVDAKNLLSSINNITNYFIDLKLTFKIGTRFIPNVKNKLVQSYTKNQHKFNLLKTLDDNNYTYYDKKNNNADNNIHTVNNNNINSDNIVNINRNSHVWNQIIDYLVEKYYFSLMFTKIIYLWSKEDRNEINNFINYLNSRFTNNENSNTKDEESSVILWEEYILLSDEQNKTSETNFNTKLFSFLRIFQYIHQIEKFIPLNKIINNIKYNIKDLIFNSEIEIEFNMYNFNLDDLFNNENYLSGVSKFIIDLFSTDNIIYIIKNTLLLSIEASLKFNNVINNNGTKSLSFDNLLNSIRIITFNNIYLNFEEFDELIIHILFEVIHNYLNYKNITQFLYKIAKLSLNHIYIINKINLKLKECENDDITSIKESIYINLVLYYLIMIDYKYCTCESDDYYQVTMTNLIDNINKLLIKMINKDFDYQVFSNIIVEIPELSSFDELNAEQINKVISNINIFQNMCISNNNESENDIIFNNINEYSNYYNNDIEYNSEFNNNNNYFENNNLIPKNLLSMILSVKIMEIYNSRDGCSNNIINLNILKNLNRVDLLAEFLISKCLVKQWNKVSIEFMFSKYGRFDLFITLQIIFHSCELLKNTKYQQLYSAYMKLAGLFSIQLYFVNSYIQEKSLDNNNNYLTGEMKKSIKSKLSCVIPNDYINELFNDYNNTDYNASINNSDKMKYIYEYNKVNIINLDLIELFEIVSNSNICHNPTLVNVILSGYEIIFGPVVHAIWPRILFINSIILPNFEYIDKYKNIFGYLNFDLLESMAKIHKNLLLYLKNKKYDDNNYSFYNIVKLNKNYDDSNFHIFDSALEWIERPEIKYNNINENSLFTNWKKLISEYVDDILLRIETCNMIDSEKLSDIIFYNKKLYNDKSLYEIL